MRRKALAEWEKLKRCVSQVQNELSPNERMALMTHCGFESTGRAASFGENSDGHLPLPFDVDAPFPPPKNPKFTFVDLFAGVGGFRIAMQNLGGKCVFSSEWDENAQKTYFANFGEVPLGDITQEATKNQIPKDFDLLCAGFPCQAFSRGWLR